MFESWLGGASFKFRAFLWERHPNQQEGQHM